MAFPPFPPSLITPVANWRIEDGSELLEDAGPDICHAPIIENQERESLWYSQHFLGKEHTNFVGVDDNTGAFAVSMLREQRKTRLILWTPKGSQNAILDVGAGETLAVSDAVKRVGWTVKTKKLKEMKKGEMVAVYNDAVGSSSIGLASGGVGSSSIGGATSSVSGSGIFTMPFPQNQSSLASSTSSLSGSSASVPLGSLTATPSIQSTTNGQSTEKFSAAFSGSGAGSGAFSASGTTLGSMTGTNTANNANIGPSQLIMGKWEAELLKLEYRMALRFASYKFGVMYVKAGQKTEEEMFSNRISSKAFKRFCKMLGNKVELKDWPMFSGGLDTKSDRTGSSSIYTQHCGYEIMFHVSTMLPWNESDQQQIDRKRHIGNDVTVIVFMDEDVSDSWSPTIISSRFPHLYAVVKPVSSSYAMLHQHELSSAAEVEGDQTGSGSRASFPASSRSLSTSYMFQLAIKDNVSSFGPPLPQPSLFDDPTTFRSFLLSKLINGEREAIRSVPDFHQNNAHLSELQSLFDRVSKDSSKNSEEKTKDSIGKSESSYALKTEGGSASTKGSQFESSSSLSVSSSKVGGSSSDFITARAPTSAAVSFAPTPGAVVTGAEKDSIAALSTSPRMLGSVHSMGVSSPSLFGVNHNRSGGAGASAAHAQATSGAGGPLTHSLYGMGGSFNLPSAPKKHSGEKSTKETSENPTNSNFGAGAQTSPSIGSLLMGINGFDKRSLLPAGSLSMYAATEQIQAFQNRPSMLNFPTEITCADAWDTSLVVGTVDGLYVLEGALEGEAKLVEVKCQLHKNQPYRRNSYQQITIIEELNIVLALIPKAGVVMYDLTSLVGSAGPPEMLLRKSKQATMYSLGSYQDALQLAISTPRGIVIHRWQDDSFVLSQIIQVSPPTIMEFDSKGYIVAASPGEIFWVKPDPESPTMNAIYTWNEKVLPLEPVSILLFEDTGEYLVCFDTVAFFVNIAGQRTRNYEFQFLSKPASIVCVFPYILSFAKQHLEIRYLANGALAQLLELDSRVESRLKFMSTSHGIQYATISASPSLGSSGSGSQAQDSSQGKPYGGGGIGTSGTQRHSSPSGQAADKELTSSSGSSATASSTRQPGHLQEVFPTATVLHSPSVFSSSAFTSTIHTLRLNTLYTCTVSNPVVLAHSPLGNPSFTLYGLPAFLGSGTTPHSLAAIHAALTSTSATGATEIRSDIAAELSKFSLLFASTAPSASSTLVYTSLSMASPPPFVVGSNLPGSRRSLESVAAAGPSFVPFTFGPSNVASPSAPAFYHSNMPASAFSSDAVGAGSLFFVAGAGSATHPLQFHPLFHHYHQHQQWLLWQQQQNLVNQQKSRSGHSRSGSSSSRHKADREANRKSIPLSQGGSGGFGSQPGSGNISAGSSPHSPGGSLLLQQHQHLHQSGGVVGGNGLTGSGVMNDGTASFDDSDDIFRTGSGPLMISQAHGAAHGLIQGQDGQSQIHPTLSPWTLSQRTKYGQGMVAVGSVGSISSMSAAGSHASTNSSAGFSDRFSASTTPATATGFANSLPLGIYPASGSNRSLSKPASPARLQRSKNEDLASGTPPTRLTSSAKISRRRSLHLDTDQGVVVIGAGSGKRKSQLPSSNQSSTTTQVEDAPLAKHRSSQRRTVGRSNGSGSSNPDAPNTDDSGLHIQAPPAMYSIQPPSPLMSPSGPPSPSFGSSPLGMQRHQPSPWFQSHRYSYDENYDSDDGFDFGTEKEERSEKEKLGDSSDSPRPIRIQTTTHVSLGGGNPMPVVHDPAQSSSGVIKKTKSGRRAASDKLSGSSERSPRSSPILPTADSNDATGLVPGKLSRHSRVTTSGSNDSDLPSSASSSVVLDLNPLQSQQPSTTSAVSAVISPRMTKKTSRLSTKRSRKSLGSPLSHAEISSSLAEMAQEESQSPALSAFSQTARSPHSSVSKTEATQNASSNATETNTVVSAAKKQEDLPAISSPIQEASSTSSAPRKVRQAASARSLPRPLGKDDPYVDGKLNLPAKASSGASGIPSATSPVKRSSKSSQTPSLEVHGAGSSVSAIVSPRSPGSTERRKSSKKLASQKSASVTQSSALVTTGALEGTSPSPVLLVDQSSSPQSGSSEKLLLHVHPHPQLLQPLGGSISARGYEGDSQITTSSDSPLPPRNPKSELPNITDQASPHAKVERATSEIQPPQHSVFASPSSSTTSPHAQKEKRKSEKRRREGEVGTSKKKESQKSTDN